MTELNPAEMIQLQTKSEAERISALETRVAMLENAIRMNSGSAENAAVKRIEAFLQTKLGMPVEPVRPSTAAPQSNS